MRHELVELHVVHVIDVVHVLDFDDVVHIVDHDDDPPVTADAGEALSRPESTASEVDAANPVGPMRATLRGVLAVVAPSTLVVALLFYFGWARTSAQAHALGLDDSLFGYSTRDYVLNSVSSMYWPLFVGAVALLVALLAYGLISVWLEQQPGRERTRDARLLSAGTAAAGVLALVLGALGARVERPTRFVSLAAPLAVTIGVVLVAYSAHLFIRYADGLGTGGYATEVTKLAPLAWSILAVLLLLSLFWSVSHYAAVRGVDLAIEAESRLGSQPSVIIYSQQRLFLEPSVVETTLSDPNAAYRYRYTGLKLLFRSQNNYFLRPADQSDARNIVIAESPGLRFEFAR
ncbi:MAG: hypothetical protein ACHQIG_06240 [Acidimicrobiia bacterium]